LQLLTVLPIGWIVRVARQKAKDIALRRDAESKDDAIDLGEVTDDLISFPRSRRRKHRGRATIDDSASSFVCSARRSVRRLEANAA